MDLDELILGDEILLHGTVGEDWSAYFTAAMVIAALAQFPGDVTVRVNSGGGNPFEGAAIHAAIKAHPGKVTMRVEGIAASAASLLVMAGDVIEMAEGATMMIHDPASVTVGTADDHRASATTLDAMADNYAAVYAARSGKTPEQAREIMKTEIYYTAAQAVAEGFADKIAGEEKAAPQMFDYSVYADAPAALMALAKDYQAGAIVARASMNTGSQASGDQKPSGAGHETVAPAAAQTLEKVTMTDEEKKALKVQQAKEATMAADKVKSDAIASERTRAKDIREMAAPFMTAGTLSEADVQAQIDGGHTAEHAGKAFMATMAQNAPATSRATITRDETDTKTEGMINALMHAAAPGRFKLEGAGTEFRGLRLKSLAMTLAGTGRGYNDHDSVRAGLVSTSMMSGVHGVSDFGYITGEVMNRTLMAEYARRAATWRMISRQRSATDFRELHSVRFGGDFELKGLKENGEYQEANLADEAEGLVVKRFGRTLGISFEAVINDDLGAFERIPAEFARAAATLESKTIWGLIRANSALKSDDVALFHADHGNKATASAISVTSVGAARKAMWEQKPFGATDADDFIEVTPDLLFVPPALETKALQFTADIQSTKDSDNNPFKSTLTATTEPRLGASAGGSESAWYMFASEMPPCEHAYLDGYEAPTIVTNEGINPDKITMTARHIFGGAVTEFRGAFKNG